MPSEGVLHPRLIACVACGDDAELVGAPGPSEPVDEYDLVAPPWENPHVPTGAMWPT